MTPFELIEPATLKDAIAAIDPDDPTVRPIAGGTALMLMMKAGMFQPRRLVSLRKLDGGFSGIQPMAMDCASARSRRSPWSNTRRKSPATRRSSRAS